MNNKIIVIVGFSASGKDSISRILEKEHGFNFVVSTSTRPIREGESQRNPYNFISKEDFLNLIETDSLIECREYKTTLNNIQDTWYYGVEKNEIEDDKQYVVVLDIGGLKDFKKHFNDRIISFFLYVDENIRKERCIKRGDFDESEWNRRLLDDKTRFTDDIIKKEIDHIIYKLDKNEIVEEILTKINLINRNNFYNFAQ